MAIQLAHAKLFPDDPLAPSTYESAATPHFKRGRTETIRPASVESVSMCKAFADRSVGAAERAAKLRAAIKAHQANSGAAKMGKGCDRHLFALRTLAERDGG